MDNILTQARAAWQAGARLRATRLRCKRYTFGDQWSDRVATNDGRIIPESVLVRDTGHNPTTHNVLRRIVSSAVGHFRRREHMPSEPSPMLEADCRTLEEFLISGCAIQRLSLQRLPGADTPRVTAEPISPARFFADSVAGAFDGSQTEMLGCLHDLTLQRLILRHAHGSAQRARRLKRLFEAQARQSEATAEEAALGCSVNDRLEFLRPVGGGGRTCCRVIEVWTCESRRQLRVYDHADGTSSLRPPRDEERLAGENTRRRNADPKARLLDWHLEMTPEWHCRYYMATGELIDSYTAPRHPFALCFYPLIDGEIHSFVDDLIDEQRHINRLLTLHDRILSTAAKGVLLYPENQLSRIMTLDEAADNWAAPDGIVLYRAQPGMPGPQQVVSSPGQLGLESILGVHLGMMQEMSGVSGAMRGKDAASGTSASLYQSQQEGSATALADLTGAFDAFRLRRDTLAALLAGTT